MKQTLFKPRSPSAGITLTSLLDVLTILLVFILSNYSNSDGKADLPQYARLPTVSALPESPSPTELSESVSVLVTDTSLRLGDRLIPLGSTETARQGARLALQEAIRNELADRGRPAARILIQADGRVPYASIDVVIMTAAALGLGRVGLVAEAGGKP